MGNNGKSSQTFRRTAAIAFLITSTFSSGVRAERINQEGRILGPAPVVTAPILFNTAQADAVISAMQIMPRDNPWNEDISRLARLSNSDAMIAQIKSDLSSSRQNLRAFYEMNFVLVPDNQARVTIPFLDYPDESDLDGGAYPNGSYPIPSNMPIETWPQGTGNLTLQQWQMDVNNDGGDRHGIIVAPGVGSIWETWQMLLTQGGWQASNGAKFDLNSNSARPAGWTSGDAAGLPMFPAVARFDECERGMVEHALRLCVAKTRREYIYPAVHYASSIPATSINYPAMGQRLRLKSSFVIPSNWTIEEHAILRALKKYGAIVADNSGGFFSISVTPDNRFPANCFGHLTSIGIDNFEVVQTTGPSGGPRSPGAPTVDAGADQTVDLSAGAILNGTVSAPSGNATVQWKLYSGPSSVNFGNANLASTSVTFTQPGVYTFELSADDTVHTVAYDAALVTVLPHVRMGNISTRAAVGVGENVAIGGFIINGSAPKQVLIRARGPSLSGAGIQGPLLDPTLALHDGAGNMIQTNDNWKDTQQQQIQSTGLAPTDDREAAIVTSLTPGNYTAIVAGKNNTGGIAIVEVYEMQAASPRLMNISTRGFVGTGDNVMIAGVILNGTDSATIVFRAIGPSLINFGIQNPLLDPTLDLFDVNGTRIVGDNNWKDSQQGAIQSSGFAPGDDRESALLVDLSPGNYTAIISGVSNTTGVALVEAYQLP